MFGLSADTLIRIQTLFEKQPLVERVVLYGSRAKGNFKPGSDIDITLFGAQLTLTQLHQIENELDDLMLPYQFDVSLHHHIQHEALLQHIERVGQVIYMSEQLQ
ncbi:MAG: nucleotidyltransferase domain-containing protein [Chitinophagaceae bacterium]